MGLVIVIQFTCQKGFGELGGVGRPASSVINQDPTFENQTQEREIP
jgi:hypothetical protein